MQCIVVNRRNGNRPLALIEQRSEEDLPPGAVLIDVHWSSLNYKDALAATGNPGVARKLPLVPGIDAAGQVRESTSDNFQAGDRVVVTGYQLGMSHWGGWSEQVRVPADWVVPLPAGLSTREAMIYGTAGFTAAQSLLALEHHAVRPAGETGGHPSDDMSGGVLGDVLVTGASGGVGSMAVALLSHQGYRVTAVSGKTDRHDWLKRLGAHAVIGRAEFVDKPPKPLLRAQWSGAVDTVGGPLLATVLREIQHRGCVAACGMAGGAELEMTVFPFILRGVTLAGIDSAECPYAQRQQIWQRLATAWKLPQLEELAVEESMATVLKCVSPMLKGELAGRHVVKISDPRHV